MQQVGDTRVNFLSKVEPAAEWHGVFPTKKKDYMLPSKNAGKPCRSLDTIGNV